MSTQDLVLESADDSDATLLDRYRQGDEDAATTLYLRYAERLRNITNKHLAPDLTARVDDEDVLQSVFRSFFRRAVDGQYNVAPGEELWKLLFVIAVNKVRSLAKYHRALKRDVRATEAGGHQRLPHLAASSTGEVAYEELQVLLREMLAALPEAQQRIVQMRLEGEEVNDIAAATKRSKRTVERVLHDFRTELHRLLNEGTTT